MLLAGILLHGAMLPLTSIAQEDLPWPEHLTGHWEGEFGGMRYAEDWNKTGDSMYSGTSTTWRNDDIVGTERLCILRFSGQWLYLADPKGDQITCFVRAEAEGPVWVFANMEHDFPKRVGYRIEGDSLSGWIAGATDDDARMEFHLVRR